MTKFYIIFIISIIIYSPIIGQIDKSQLYGDWIKYNAERKDGSKVIDRLGTESAYIEYSFSKKKFCFTDSPSQKRDCISYSLQNEFLELSKGSQYIIEKLENDTLIIVENYSDFKEDKLTRLYFIRKEKILIAFPLKYENQLAVMNKYSAPKFTKDFEWYIYNQIKQNFSLTKFKGSLIIDIPKKRIETTISELMKSDEILLESMDSNKELLSLIKKSINKSFKLWEFEKIHKDLKRVKIYFVGKTLMAGYLKSMRFSFYTQDYDYLDRSAKTTLEDIRLSNQYFVQGIQDSQNENYKSAISKFTKSYELDPIMIDAIYNRASIYQALGELENACKDWKYLKELGQKEANRNLLEFCK